MDFVLALHSHLPWVLNHGRWPHGTDWLCEAATDCYLPLLVSLHSLRQAGVPSPITLGITPVLAAQLADPLFTSELEAFFEQRLATCDEAPHALRATGDGHLVPLAAFWKDRFLALRSVFRSLEGGIIGACAQLEREGRVELLSSAATHGFLPLLSRDESIRLQLAAGRLEHRRLFGRDANGCWLPECAYRSRGPWNPHEAAPHLGVRRGIEEHLVDAGYRFFFTDAHLAQAGRPLDLYGGLEREPGEGVTETAPPRRSPYQAYRVTATAHGSVSVLIRDPVTSHQVWSRHDGYPGDEAYLEFHKIRWPGGLRLWRVSRAGTDLGEKEPYDPARARNRSGTHAEHFVGVLAGLARAGDTDVVAAPFDTELFGHWWFEGLDFLEAVYRGLPQASSVNPVTASAHLQSRAPTAPLHLAQGSWGARGDFSMWLNPGTEWTWRRLWRLEEDFWNQAPAALADPRCHPVLSQAARELLLVQASDWQFMISTGEVSDYAERRFREHAENAEALVALLAGGESGFESGGRRAAELQRRNGLFPDILSAVEAAARGSREFGL